MKKAQGISMNVIIIAAIALLVLVVLSVIFLGRSADWGIQTADCENKGGKCAAAGVSCGEAGSTVEEYGTPYAGWKCSGEDASCCIKPGS